MPNTHHNAWKARLVKRRKELAEMDAGSLEDALRIQFRTILACHAVVEDELEKETPDRECIRAMTYAISNANATYAKLKEVGEFEGRLQDLEAAVTTRANGRTNGRA